MKNAKASSTDNATAKGQTVSVDAVAAGFGEDALWRKQQAIIRRRRSKLALSHGRASANCRCLCGLIFTTKGISQHQRRCVVQQESWGWPGMAKPSSPNPKLTGDSPV